MSLSEPEVAALIGAAFVPLRFSMTRHGLGADPEGRALVEQHRRRDRSSIYPPDLLVLDSQGEIRARFNYDVDAAGLTQALRDIAGDGAARYQEDSGTAELRRQLEAGAAAYREGDFEAARARWAQVVADAPAHALADRARYLLLDQETWPTRPHPLTAGAALPGIADRPVHVPDIERRAALHAALTDLRVSPSGLSFRRVPAGRFRMGGSPAQFPRELPQREVELSDGFWMGLWPVTRAQWRRFDSARWPGAESEGLAGELPATGIAFERALAFCAAMSERDGVRYRLPTEAEWEYAARGGLNEQPYPWGDAEIDASRCNYAHPRPVPVGCYAPNGYGLFDMVGNVQEWTADAYAEDAYAQTAELVRDPTGPQRGDHDEALRVVRGGLCGSVVCAVMCRVSFRVGIHEGYDGGSIALRLVLSD